MATAMALFELVNGLSHVAQGFMMGYNSGLVTGIIIFLPIAIWTVYAVYGKKHLGWGHFVLTLAVGLLYHVILIAGCRLAVAGALMGFAQCVYMTIDAVLLVGLNHLINRSKIGNWTAG